jgi:hypothetical protein
MMRGRRTLLDALDQLVAGHLDFFGPGSSTFLVPLIVHGPLPVQVYSHPHTANSGESPS